MLTKAEHKTRYLIFFFGLLMLYFATRDFQPNHHKFYEYLEFTVTGGQPVEIVNLDTGKIQYGLPTEKSQEFFAELRRYYKNGFAVLWVNQQKELWLSLYRFKDLTVGECQVERYAETKVMPTIEETIASLSQSSRQVISAISHLPLSDLNDKLETDQFCHSFATPKFGVVFYYANPPNPLRSLPQG